MPNRDRTGPVGEGALTGRGLGPCGQGLGRGLGPCGRGFRRAGFRVSDEPVELSKEQKIKILEAEKAELDAENAEVEKELKALRK